VAGSPDAARHGVHDGGAVMAEYAILVTLIALAAFVGLETLGFAVRDLLLSVDL
jgi:Flp pilus assembly pilin Flp